MCALVTNPRRPAYVMRSHQVVGLKVPDEWEQP